mgnify:CR=1 FL=1
MQFQKLLGGNSSLDPEESKNATLGIVYEGVKNLTLSADLWAIKLEHQIDSLSEDDVFADGAKSLMHHLWPEGRVDLKVRVVLALLCLLLAKVVNSMNRVQQQLLSATETGNVQAFLRKRQPAAVADEFLRASGLK